MLTLLYALFATPVLAAQATALPPFLRGDIEIAYDVRVVPDTLREGDAAVGSRRAIDHDLAYIGRFGFAKGFALELALPHHASNRMRFFDSHQMVYDPNLDTGTMIGTDELPKDTEIHGKGAGGTWIRVLATPFSETTYAPRGDQITWRIGVGYQFKDDTNVWTHDENGERGAGPGAPAFELSSVWSTTNQMSQPYLGVVWTKRFPHTIDIRGPSGKTVNTGVEIEPASAVDLTAGLEIQLHEDTEWANGLGSEVALDLHTRFGYRTAADIPSGVTLPSVLAITENTIVTQSETSDLWGGIGVRWRIIEYLDWTSSFELGGPMAYRVEHPYEVSTATGKAGWAVGTALTFRMRDPMFDQ